MKRLLPALLLALAVVRLPGLQAQLPPTGNFARTNLVAWCIVPFDSQKRGPEERAAMLERLGISRLAYDWRAEHIPTFDAEVEALQRHHIELTAWWFPAALNDDAKAILACLERHHLSPQLWVSMFPGPEPDPGRLDKAINDALVPLGEVCAAARKLGSTVALYNHNGWFGEPANQITLIRRLRAAGHTNVGIVWNFHHGHDHIGDFAKQLLAMQPYLVALNLNGMVRGGDRNGKLILPLGTGDEELRMLQLVNASGWTGPVGILGHTDEDAEVKLRKELEGLEKLAPVAARPPGLIARELRFAAMARPPEGLSAPQGSLAAGKFGLALDARLGGLEFDGQPRFRQAPMSIEAWVRLEGSVNFNIIAASEAKSSPTHWELYTYAHEGDLSFYSPGNTPAEVRSGVNVCDGQWHHVAAQLSATHVRLFVDGKKVTETRITRTHESDGFAAQFALGRLVGDRLLGCDGLLDDVRVSYGLRLISGIPKAPAEKDMSALAIWSFDDGEAAPESPKTPAAGGTKALKPALAANGLAGEPAVSGRDPGTQGEKDWVDNRWQATDIGPFLASNLRLPDGSVIARALTIRTSYDNGLRVVPDNVAMVFDTQTCSLRGTWTLGSVDYLKFDPARFGLIGTPTISGEVAFLTPPPDPAETPSKFVGLRLTSLGTVLEYEIGGSRVLETQGATGSGGHGYFLRSLQFAPSDKQRTIVLFATDTPAMTRLPGVGLHHMRAGDRQPMIAVIDQPSEATGSPDEPGCTLGTKSWLDAHGKQVHAGVLVVPPSRSNRTVKVACWPHGPGSIGNPGSGAQRVKPFGILDKVGQPSEMIRKHSTRWNSLTTRGQRGADADFLAVDTLTLPYDNPAKALLFASGIDFTPDGAGYLCTIHGDVWRVTGIDNSLEELTWQRYATGLFQPLGLKVRDGKVFVLGRDRITRLHDENGDGEADFYENFFDGIATSTGGHDYVTCLETDAAGNFYYVDPLGLHRVAADGKRQETLATGFRNPNGMGVRPDGQVITAAPQQGTWTPSSGIWEVRPDNVGLYGGYGGPKVTPARPLGYDAPLCWIPHGVDNSSGSQAWIPPGRWGPLGGQMLHLLWGRCGMMLVMRDEVGGPVSAVNGAVVPLPVKFLSGPNRATFNPRDGALYVAGSTGWQTSAVKDGALQRVRFTGKTPSLPVRWAVKPGGLEVTFSRDLEPTTARDAGSYALKQWNYRYAEQYGSKDWSVAAPEKEGRDELKISAARLADDRRTVLLEIPELKPVMQFELKYNVDAQDGGKPLRGSFWGTVNRMR